MKLTSAAVLALTPLLILPGYFFYYDITPKIVIVLMGAAVGLLLLLRGSMLSQARRLWVDPVGRCFCVLAAAQIFSLAVSTFFSSNPALSWNGGNWRRFGFVLQSAVIALAFMIALSCAEGGLRILLRAVTAAGTAVALYGILQYFGVDPILSPAIYHIGDGVTAIVRPPATLGQADYFAGYLLYVVFLGAALTVTEVTMPWKTLGAVAAIAGSSAILLSGTRGALLGLAAGAVSLWIWNGPRLARRHGVLFAGMCAIVIAFYLSPAGLKLRARSQWALEDLRGGARIWLWRDSLRMASERLLLGYGPETFGQDFPRYQSIELSRAYPDFYHESPHSIFLDALVSEGIPGLGILAGFALLASFAAKRGIIHGQLTAPYLGAALVAGLTSGLFVCFTLPGSIYFDATVAMLVGLTLPPIARLTASPAPLSLRLPSLGINLIASALFVYFAIRLTVTDVALAQAKSDLDAGRIDASVTAYARSQRWHTAGSSDDLDFSRAFVAASGSASLQAFLVAKRAVETSEERQNAWYNLAEFFAAQDDPADMEACLRHSVDASPNWFKSHWALAQMLLISGRRTEALAEAVRAAELDGGKDPEIAKFLQTVNHQPGASKAE